MDKLAEFESALDAAYFDLFITWEERQKALEEYRAEVLEWRKP